MTCYRRRPLRPHTKIRNSTVNHNVNITSHPNTMRIRISSTADRISDDEQDVSADHPRTDR